MKKIEAQELAPEKSKLIIEYITEILSDPDKVNGKMNFSFAKINNQSMCVLDIYVPKGENSFEKHLNLGITSDHSHVLYEQLLNDLLDSFMEHESMGITGYYSINSLQGLFSGINAFNLNGSNIKINFGTRDPKFEEIIDNYTKRIHDFEEKENKSR